MKKSEGVFDVPTNNEDFYKMDWDETRTCQPAKELGHVENKPLPEV